MTVELLQERRGTWPRPAPRPPELLHVVCACSYDDDVVFALCGWDVCFDDRHHHGDRVQLCRVCNDLASHGCEVCGFGVRHVRRFT